MNLLLKFTLVAAPASFFLSTHSHFVETFSSSCSDVFHSFHRTQCTLRDFPVVSLGAIALALKLESRVTRGVFAVQNSVRLRPLYLAGISFHLEVLVAF